MKFKYTTDARALDTRGKMVKRPLLELELLDTHGTVARTAFALIDSGADTTMVNAQYAPLLGIDLSHAPYADVIGIASSPVKTRTALLHFKIKQTGDIVAVPAQYIQSDNVNILLGQEVFFDMFKIKFEKDHDIFEIVKVKK